MTDNEFGEYLREMRISHAPSFSQETLGELVGYTKMAISQFETGKASPPQGQRLEDLIAALDASPEQAERLRFLSARARHTIPDDIFEFFYTDSSLYMAIRETKAAGEGNKGLADRLAAMGDDDGTE